MSEIRIGAAGRKDLASTPSVAAALAETPAAASAAARPAEPSTAPMDIPSAARPAVPLQEGVAAKTRRADRSGLVRRGVVES